MNDHFGKYGFICRLNSNLALIMRSLIKLRIKPEALEASKPILGWKPLWVSKSCALLLGGVSRHPGWSCVHELCWFSSSIFQVLIF